MLPGLVSLPLAAQARGLKFQTSTQNSSSSTITVPATAAAGDIAVLCDSRMGTSSSAVTPTGWTNVVNYYNSPYRLMVSYKVLAAGDVGATVTGIASGTITQKIMLIFRPSGLGPSVNSGTFSTAATVNSMSSISTSATGRGVPSVLLATFVDYSSDTANYGTPAAGFGASTTPAFTVLSQSNTSGTAACKLTAGYFVSENTETSISMGTRLVAQYGIEACGILTMP